MRFLRSHALSGVGLLLDTLIKRLESLRTWVRTQDKSTQAQAARQHLEAEKSKTFLPPLSARSLRRNVISPLHLAHCCPIHGCSYGEQDCPVFVARADPYFAANNGCPACEPARG